MKLFKLGTTVTDSASNVKGTLTHCQVFPGGFDWYNFQPKALDPKSGLPVKKCWITADRVRGEETIEVDLPLAIIDTKVTDKVTGFSGKATSFILHMNGCLHVEVQPEGTRETGEVKEPVDFDIKQLEGKAITKKLKKVAKPSPMSFDKIR
jgi:hypothetical protein